MARPTKYKPEYANTARSLCKLGATNPIIAEALGVSTATIVNWMNEHDGFLAAVKEGKELADDYVRQALYHRACGAVEPDSDIRVIDGQIVITPLEKHYPPDTAAAMAWLHNRCPDEWKPRKAAETNDAVESIAESLSKLASGNPD